VLLEKGLPVSPEASAQMKEILGDPGISHKFVRGLGDRTPGTCARPEARFATAARDP
jgi:hypothetical protein